MLLCASFSAGFLAWQVAKHHDSTTSEATREIAFVVVAALYMSPLSPCRMPTRAPVIDARRARVSCMSSKTRSPPRRPKLPNLWIPFQSPMHRNRTVEGKRKIASDT